MNSILLKISKLKEFEAESFVKLWRRDSRTLAASQTRIKRLKDANVDIKYAEATYCACTRRKILQSSDQN